MTRIMLAVVVGIALAAARDVRAQPEQPPGEPGFIDPMDMPSSSIGAIQRELIARGYPTKAIGAWGEGTSAALSAFQADQGLPVTGFPDLATLRALGLAPGDPATAPQHARGAESQPDRTAAAPNERAGRAPARAQGRTPPADAKAERKGDKQHPGAAERSEQQQTRSSRSQQQGSSRSQPVEAQGDDRSAGGPRIEDDEDMSPGWSPRNPAVEGGTPRRSVPPRADAVEATLERTQRVLATVERAQDAIRIDEAERAASLLDRAARDLRAMYRSAPGGEVVRSVERLQQQLSNEGQARAAAGEKQKMAGDLAPLFARVREQLVFSDPAAVAAAKDAEKRVRGGELEAAADQLRLARARLVADLAFLPIEDAYARVMAAQSELEYGDTHSATRLLDGVPVVLETVAARAPLVPVRFDLRAAAIAAERGDWIRATELVGQASQHLDRISDDATTPEFDRMAADAKQLQSRIAAGNRVDPADIRKLARRTRDIELG